MEPKTAMLILKMFPLLVLFNIIYKSTILVLLLKFCEILWNLVHLIHRMLLIIK